MSHEATLAESHDFMFKTSSSVKLIDLRAAVCFGKTGSTSSGSTAEAMEWSVFVVFRDRLPGRGAGVCSLHFIFALFRFILIAPFVAISSD